jgi:hypothetical protein
MPTTLERQWYLYLTYLVQWATDHIDLNHYGMSPVGFDEWVDNEYAELKEDEK